MPRYSFARHSLEVMGDHDVEPLLLWAIFDSQAGRNFPIGYMGSADTAQRVCDALNSHEQV